MENKQKEELDLDKILYPQSYKIKKNYCQEGDLLSYDVQIVDEELDAYDVHISYEGMEINTKNYTHISLELWHLTYLHNLLLEFNEETGIYNEI
mgnify:CR=1 FL=1